MRRAGAFIFIMAFTAWDCVAGSIASPYQIGTWRGFRPAAITYTFDDDLPNQYAVAVPMFSVRGFKLTLFTVTTWVPGGSWTPVKTAASFGHEIASHTVTHPTLSGLSTSQQSTELKNSQAAINANVPSQQCLTLAYPYCVAGDEAITSQYYIAARGCSGQLVPSTPPDFMNISSFVCGSQGSIQTVQDFNNMANSAANADAWCVYLIHALDNDKGYSPFPSATLQASLDYLSANSNKFWVEAFGNVVRYIRERNASGVTELSNRADSITIQVTNNLDGAIYNYPITLRRPLPMNWLSAFVSQGNLLDGTQIINIGATNYVVFDVVPGGRM